MRNAAAIALLTSLVLALVGISLAVSEHAETRARLDQRLALQADGEAGARGRPVHAHAPGAPAPGRRRGIPRRRLRARDRGAATAINRALGSLERAEPGLVGAASAIGLDGRERARVVRGEAAPVDARSRATSATQPFFRATLGTRPGGVHVSQPYRSADTGQWVVSNSALVRDDRGAPLGIVRFELRSRACARRPRPRSAAKPISRSRSSIARAGARSSTPRTACSRAGPGPQPAYRELTSAWADEGTMSAGGLRLAYRTLTGVPGSLGWVVVAGSPQPSLLAAAGLSPGVLALLAVARRARRRRRHLAARAAPRRDAGAARGRGRPRRGRAALAHRRADGPLQPPPRARLDRRRARPLRAHRRAAERDAARPRPLPAHQRRLRPRRRRSRPERDRRAPAGPAARLRRARPLGRRGVHRARAGRARRRDAAPARRADPPARRRAARRDRRRRPAPGDGLDRSGARGRRAALGRGAGRLRRPRARRRQAPRARSRAAVRRSDGRGPGRRGARADPAGPRARRSRRARARACRTSTPSASPTWRSRSPSRLRRRPGRRRAAAGSADCYTT